MLFFYGLIVEAVGEEESTDYMSSIYRVIGYKAIDLYTESITDLTIEEAFKLSSNNSMSFSVCGRGYWLDSEFLTGYVTNPDKYNSILIKINKPHLGFDWECKMYDSNMDITRDFPIYLGNTKLQNGDWYMSTGNIVILYEKDKLSKALLCGDRLVDIDTLRVTYLIKTTIKSAILLSTPNKNLEDRLFKFYGIVRENKAYYYKDNCIVLNSISDCIVKNGVETLLVVDSSGNLVLPPTVKNVMCNGELGLKNIYFSKSCSLGCLLDFIVALMLNDDNYSVSLLENLELDKPSDFVEKVADFRKARLMGRSGNYDILLVSEDIACELLKDVFGSKAFKQASEKLTYIENYTGSTSIDADNKCILPDEPEGDSTEIIRYIVSNIKNKEELLDFSNKVFNTYGLNIEMY